MLAATGTLLLAAAPAPGGAVLFVDDDAVPGGDGTTWETALTGLSEALDLERDVGPADADSALGRLEVAGRHDAHALGPDLDGGSAVHRIRQALESHPAARIPRERKAVEP